LRFRLHDCLDAFKGLSRYILDEEAANYVAREERAEYRNSVAQLMGNRNVDTVSTRLEPPLHSHSLGDPADVFEQYTMLVRPQFLPRPPFDGESVPSRGHTRDFVTIRLVFDDDISVV